jgi:hypothetical protein
MLSLGKARKVNSAYFNNAIVETIAGGSRNSKSNCHDFEAVDDGLVSSWIFSKDLGCTHRIPVGSVNAEQFLDTLL